MINESYFKIGWRPCHPNIIRKYDRDRLKKKNIKRWIPVEERNAYYVWFYVDSKGTYPYDL